LDTARIIRLGRDTGLGDRICALTAAREFARRHPGKKVLFSGMDEIVRAFGDGLVEPAPFDASTDKMYCDGRFRKKGSSPDGNLVGCYMAHLGMEPDGRRPELPDVKPVLPQGTYVAIQPWAYFAPNPSPDWVQALVDHVRNQLRLKMIVVGHPNKTSKFLVRVDYMMTDRVLPMFSLIRHAALVLAPPSAITHTAAAYQTPLLSWLGNNGEDWLSMYKYPKATYVDPTTNVNNVPVRVLIQ